MCASTGSSTAGSFVSNCRERLVPARRRIPVRRLQVLEPLRIDSPLPPARALRGDDPDDERGLGDGESACFLDGQRCDDGRKQRQEPGQHEVDREQWIDGDRVRRLSECPGRAFPFVLMKDEEVAPVIDPQLAARRIAEVDRAALRNRG